MQHFQYLPHGLEHLARIENASVLEIRTSPQSDEQAPAITQKARGHGLSQLSSETKWRCM